MPLCASIEVKLIASAGHLAAQRTFYELIDELVQWAFTSSRTSFRNANELSRRE